MRSIYSEKCLAFFLWKQLYISKCSPKCFYHAPSSKFGGSIWFIIQMRTHSRARRPCVHICIWVCVRECGMDSIYMESTFIRNDLVRRSMWNIINKQKRRVDWIRVRCYRWLKYSNCHILHSLSRFTGVSMRDAPLNVFHRVTFLSYPLSFAAKASCSLCVCFLLCFEKLISFCVRTQHQLHRFKHVRSTSNVINVTRNETFWFFIYVHTIEMYSLGSKKDTVNIGCLFLARSALTYAYMLSRMQKQRKEPIQIRRKSSPKRVGRSEHGNNEKLLQSSTARLAIWPNVIRHNAHGNEYEWSTVDIERQRRTNSPIQWTASEFLSAK